MKCHPEELTRRPAVYEPRRDDPCVYCLRALGDGPTAGAGTAHPDCWEEARRALAEPGLADPQLSLYDAPATLTTTFISGRGPYA